MAAMDPVMFDDEPRTRWLADDLDRFLVWASQTRRASDIALASNEPIWLREQGVWHRRSRRPLESQEIADLIDTMARRANASAQIKSAEDQDFAHEITVGRGERVRFRVNGSGCRDGWQPGFEVVLRTIPALPPRWADLQLEPELARAFFPRYGLVLVTGPVGSGKSTLLFGGLRHIAETPPGRHIITYESPIEFDLVGVPNRVGLVIQTEVPTHLKSFEVAPRNSLRRAGDVLLFGESRDPETIKNMTIAAETGVAVYSTVHTNSVAETISRMAREFPYSERESMAATLIAATRLIVHQRLLRTPDGGRVAVREFLAFDEDVREALMGEPLNRLIQATQALVVSRGQSLWSDVQRKHAAGRVDDEEFQDLRRIFEREVRHVA